MKRLLLTAAAAAALSASPVLGDEVIFKNGDRITGTIVKAIDGKLTIKTQVAGQVTVDLSDVQTFTTDQPIAIELKDGSVLPNRNITASTQPGVIQSQGAADAPVQPQPLPLADVAAINTRTDTAEWTGAVIVGGTITRGNSKSENLSARGEATRRTKKDRLNLGAGYLFGRETDRDTGVKTTTTDNWFATGKYDYFFTQKFYGFGAMRIEKDRIANLDLRLVPSGGVGYQWIDDSNLKFNTEAGLAWVYESYSNDGTDQHIAGRLAYHVDWKINDKVSFVHDLEYLPSFEDISDFNLIAQAGIRSTLTDKMFAELKLENRYDASPAPGAVKNDLRYILGVGWRF